MEYLESVYKTGKQQGFFKKFDTFSEFKKNFKDEVKYKDLHKFLCDKGIDVPELSEFMEKITGKPLSKIKETTAPSAKKHPIFDDTPVSAYDTVTYTATQRGFPKVIKLGTMELDNLELPLMLPLYGSGGIALYTRTDNDKKNASQLLQKLAFRLLTSLPDGKCKFYLIDNQMNGQSFTSLFGLDPRVLEKDIWDDDIEIVNGLQDLKNAIPKVQTELLTTKYKDLQEYNEKVTHSRQPFQFILIANFPWGFTPEALNHLQAILKNGSKSGVYCLMSVDKKFKLKHDEFPWANFDELAMVYDFSSNTVRNFPSADYINEHISISSVDNTLDFAPETIKEQVNKSLDKVQRISITLDESKLQNLDASNGVTIPIGATQDDKTVNLQLGDGKDEHHALIGGATGKGKSVLLHNIILNAAKLYSPNELQLILLDYKEGTEFKLYENLPNLKILAISEEIEFGLSVLEFLKEEISKRGSLFKAAGVADLHSYKKVTGEVLPRYLVIMDEFQVLLDPKKRESSTISGLIEFLTRQGRSFGVNFILSTQSLSDVEISASTLSQLAIRIALAMPESDCVRMLNVDNMVPSTFSKAGQAIYNNQHGKNTGNLLFQVAFIDKLQLKAEVEKFTASSIEPFIFEGDQQVDFSSNTSLAASVQKRDLPVNDKFVDLYIGQPFFISEKHAFYRYRKQQLSNMLIVGDDPLAAISSVYHSCMQLILQSSPGSKFYIFDFFSIDSGYSGKFDSLQEYTNSLTIINKSKKIEETLDTILQEIQERMDTDKKERIGLFFMNTHTLRDLRMDGYNESPLSKKLASIIKDGPECGVHTCIHLLNRKSFDEIFDRKIVSEFENLLILKGQSPSDYGDYTSDSPKTEFTAYLCTPWSKYGSDKIKIYRI